MFKNKKIFGVRREILSVTNKENIMKRKFLYSQSRRVSFENYEKNGDALLTT